MKLLPHQVLKKLADGARNRAQYELAALGRRREALRRQREQVQAHIEQIVQQREQAIRMTVQAGTLMMYNDLINEQRRLIERLEGELEALHGEEQGLLRQWLEHDNRGKAFERIDRKFIAEANRALDRKLQQLDDDRIAGRICGSLAGGV